MSSRDIEWLSENPAYQDSNSIYFVRAELGVVLLPWVINLYLFVRHGLFRTLIIDNHFRPARVILRVAIVPWAFGIIAQEIAAWLHLMAIENPAHPGNQRSEYITGCISVLLQNFSRALLGPFIFELLKAVRHIYTTRMAAPRPAQGEETVTDGGGINMRNENRKKMLVGSDWTRFVVYFLCSFDVGLAISSLCHRLVRAAGDWKDGKPDRLSVRFRPEMTAEDVGTGVVLVVLAAFLMLPLARTNLDGQLKKVKDCLWVSAVLLLVVGICYLAVAALVYFGTETLPVWVQSVVAPIVTIYLPTCIFCYGIYVMKDS